MQKAEMELQKGENMLKHEEEIFSRPARTWFQSSKDKTKAEGRFLSIQTSPADIRQNAAESNMKPGLVKPKKSNLLAIQQRRWLVPYDSLRVLTKFCRSPNAINSPVYRGKQSDES